MKKNDEFVVTIDDIGSNMEGIAHVDGQTLFVPFTIPGEQVKARVINTKSHLNICKAVQILTPSEHRVQPLCPYYGRCGGCDCMHIDYLQQLEYKTNHVSTTLCKMLGSVKVNKCIGSANYRYRNKMALPVVQTPQGVQIGIYRVGSHKVIELKDCVISKPFVSQLISATLDYINKYSIAGYSEEDNSGTIRHIVCRQVGGSMLITLVCTTDKLPHIDYYTKLLDSHFDNYSLNINVNSAKTNVIFGSKFVQVKGNSSVECTSHGIVYPISSFSFMQVNDEVREKIYDYALSLVEKSDYVVDAYSGAGLLTAMLSTKCKYAYGIEIVEAAVKNANNLVKNNKITNVTNVLGDCAKCLPDVLDKCSGNMSLVLDPPRKGCSSGVLQTIIDSDMVNSIVYISCNPATLARDLKILSTKYNILSVQPFDMFPNTKHVETVVKLIKK